MTDIDDGIWLPKELMGQVVRRLREERLQMTQEDLGVALGYASGSAQGTVGQIEGGVRPVPDTKLLKLARMADVPISYFMVEGVAGEDRWKDGYLACVDKFERELHDVLVMMRENPAVTEPSSQAGGGATTAARAAQRVTRRARRGNAK